MGIGNAEYSKSRAPTVAGIFYPEEKSEVEAALAAYDSAAAGDGKGKEAAVALIVPHAGWELSGKVASDAFRAASGRKVSTVVVLGPMHRGRADGLFLTESEYFQTPVGDIPVDQTLCAELESCGTNFVVNDIPHLEEHSIEIVLPFVKRLFPAASLVPVLVSGAKSSVVRALANGLDFVFGPIADSVLFVVSTNLCANLEAGTARRHADDFLSRLEAGDVKGLVEGAAAGTLSACGTGACAALISTELIGARRPVVVSRSDSSDRADHDPRRLVRYAGIAYF